MPAPAAPGGFSLTNDPVGSPNFILEWTHAGVDLDRYEVLFREVGETVWVSYAIFTASTLLVSGTTYQLEVTSPPDFEWVVRALNAVGEVSV